MTSAISWRRISSVLRSRRSPGKRAIRRDIHAQKAESIVDELLSVPIHLEPAVELVPAALRIALQTQRTVYDSIYLALAVQSGHPLLTGDRKLFDAINAGPLAPHIRWIGDVT
jgi:predicted nucleic acid-binding protein